MKFAVHHNPAVHGTDPDALVAFARHAEACGFEALYLPEHVVLHPGARFGTFEVPPTLPFADPLDCLAFVAAATDRLLLGTAVLLVPYHHPVPLAKRLATIDLLSRGRMRLLTVGVGTLPGEAAALGVDFATRGRRADETIDALRLLWASGPDGADLHGGLVAFEGVCSYPKPWQATVLPVHVGGSSPAAARRAGRRGDGWFPGGLLTPAERRAQWDLVRATATDAGRDPALIEHTRWGSLGMVAEDVAGLAAEGVTRVVVGAAATDPQERLDELSAFAERLIG